MSYFDKDRAADGVSPRMASFPKPGISSVGEYQQAGMPWMVTKAVSDASTEIGTEVLFDDSAGKFEFPYVAKSVTIRNNAAAGGTDVYISFCSLNVSDDADVLDSAVLVHKNYHVLGPTESITYNAKCRRVYVSENGSGAQTVSVSAELTGIEHDYDLDVEGISGISDA